MLSRDLKKLDVETDLELASSREVRELAIRSKDSTKEVIEAAEKRFGDADKARREFLDKALKAINETPPPPKELASQFNFQDYIKAGIKKGALDGAMKELNQELNLAWEYGVGGISFPANLFFDDMKPIEEAADTATAVTNVSPAQPQNMGMITPLVYARNIGSFLGIAMPMVAPGEHAYPYMTGGSAVAFVAEAAGVDAQALTFDVVDLLPVRVTARVLINGEAMQRLGPELEAVARSDMQMAMANLVDTQLMTGTGSSNQLKGILTQVSTKVQADGDTGATADDTAYTWGDYTVVPVAHLDDKIFTEPSMLRLVIGQKTLAHATRVKNSTSNPTLSGMQAMRASGMAVRYSGRIAAPSVATGSKGSLQSALLVSADYASNIVMPQWQAASLIVDPYTKSDSDQVAFTLRRYLNLGYRRSGTAGVEGVKHLQFTLTDKT